MTMVDTSVWIDFFADRETSQVRFLRKEILTKRASIGDIIMCEVLQGIRSDREFELVRQRLFTLEVVTICDPYIAVQAARNYRWLRQQGITIRRTIDCLIATCCIERGYVLLHNDRDFDAFEEHLGLLVAR